MSRVETVLWVCAVATVTVVSGLLLQVAWR